MSIYNSDVPDKGEMITGESIARRSRGWCGAIIIGVAVTALPQVLGAE